MSILYHGKEIGHLRDMLPDLTPSRMRDLLKCPKLVMNSSSSSVLPQFYSKIRHLFSMKDRPTLLKALISSLIDTALNPEVMWECSK